MDLFYDNIIILWCEKNCHFETSAHNLECKITIKLLWDEKNCHIYTIPYNHELKVVILSYKC